MTLAFLSTDWASCRDIVVYSGFDSCFSFRRSTSWHGYFARYMSNNSRFAENYDYSSFFWNIDKCCGKTFVRAADSSLSYTSQTEKVDVTLGRKYNCTGVTAVAFDLLK